MVISLIVNGAGTFYIIVDFMPALILLSILELGMLLQPASELKDCWHLEYRSPLLLHLRLLIFFMGMSLNRVSVILTLSLVLAEEIVHILCFSVSIC